MKKWFLLSTICVLSVFWAGALLGADYDMTGTWVYKISNETVNGMCPAAPDREGTATITQSGNEFTMVLSEFECNPESMCTYTGTVSGATYTATNSDAVDSEGGTVENKVVFTVVGGASAAGEGTSTYLHPGGFRCDWKNDVTLTK
jgi:hypothetical protein